MPRNSSGTYSLPAGNPVVTGTTISSTWANTTLSDLATAMTDSLSRSGDGGMTASLALSDGAVGAPGLSWGSEATSGLYRAGAGDFRYSISSTDKLQLITTGLGVPAAGTAANPALFVLGDTNTGLYSVGADDLGISIGGTLRVDFSTTVITSTLVLRGPSGTNLAPAFSFSGDSNTGIYSSGADILDFATGGTGRVTLSTTLLTIAVPLVAPDGTVGAPTHSFSADPDTGIYRSGPNKMSFTAGNSFAFAANNSGSGAQISANDGSASLPIYTFDNDLDTGFYRDTANQIGITLGGTTAGQIAQGSYTGTLTGCTTSPTATISYQRVGNHVMLLIPPLSGTSNATTMTITGAPAVIRPSATSGTSSIANVFNNSSAPDDVPYSANMSSGGVLTFNKGISGSSGFTSSGTKGISSTNGSSGACFYYYVN